WKAGNFPGQSRSNPSPTVTISSRLLTVARDECQIGTQSTLHTNCGNRLIVLLELLQLGPYRRRLFQATSYVSRCLETISGNHQHRRLIRIQPALADQLPSHGHGHASRCFRKDALRLGKQPDALHNLFVSDVFTCSTTLQNDLHSVNPVGRVSDG